MATQKATSKKATQTQKSKNAKAPEIKNFTDQDILNMDLDNLNLDEILAKRTPVKNKNGKVINGEKKERDPMFIIPSELTGDKIKIKRFRSKVRKQRNRYIGEIINLKMEKNEKVLGDKIKAFKEFYKKHYIVQDFSINSLAKANSDKDTLANIKIALKIIQAHK